MSKIITIENVARIEGHASIAIYVDKYGKVEKAEYIATEPSRGFDTIFKGKHASEVPGLAARICGICYAAHNICACKALEYAWETNIPDSAKKIRELLLLANTLSSHALHTVFLAGPGLLIDGVNTITDLQKKYPDFLEAGIELRMIGQQIGEIIAGRKVHTIISVPGGVLKTLNQEEIDKILTLLDATTKSMKTIEEYTYRIINEKKDFLLSYGKIETNFLAIKQSKKLELYNDDSMELLMKDETKEYLSSSEVLERITEEEKEYSYIRHPYITSMGPNNGQFRVGPVARIQNAKWDNNVFHKFKETFGTFTQSAMSYDISRVAEMFECIKGMRDIIASGLDKDIKNVAYPKDGIGVAIVEAPRGALLHQYETDNEGIVKKARVIAPTTFHQGSIERSTFESAREVLDSKKGDCSDEDKVKIEQVIRAYDPCMSCGGATQLRIIKRQI
ncbi:MAG: Ni/Fe hydrogenase subunit alpha [bacterium]|nr:Ni/Fe hydrogenase subunit alpha [bacterium]